MILSTPAVQYYLLFVDFDELTIEEKRRRDRRIPREALRFYSESAFTFLFESLNEQALINCTALDHAAFKELHLIFKPYFDNYYLTRKGDIRPIARTRNGKLKGRRRDIDARGCLGLVLYWYRTQGSCARGIAMAFGLTSTRLYLYIKFGRRLLLYVLQNHPAAKIYIPTQEEMIAYKAAIESKYPILEDVWAAADGLKIRIAAPGNYMLQNRYYNGWKSGHYINCVFVFAPDGKIRICTINAPGTWHDSTMADYGVYEKIEHLYKEYGGKVVVDSAFNLSDKPYLIKSSQKDPIGDAHGVSLNRDATSLRQLSEWGMRMIQGQFPRLKDPIPYEEAGERKVILSLMIYLYNYNTSRVGINEILNTFMTERNDTFYGNSISENANAMFN